MTGKFTFKGEEDNNGNGNVQEAINQVTESYKKADRELKQELEEKISEITTGTEVPTLSQVLAKGNEMDKDIDIADGKNFNNFNLATKEVHTNSTDTDTSKLYFAGDKTILEHSNSYIDTHSKYSTQKIELDKDGISLISNFRHIGESGNPDSGSGGTTSQLDFNFNGFLLSQENNGNKTEIIKVDSEGIKTKKISQTEYSEPTDEKDYVTKKYLDEKISNQGNSFIKKGSSDDKVLLGNGGEKDLSQLENKNIQIGGRNLVIGTGKFEMLELPFYLQPNYLGNAGFVNETFRGNKVIKLIHNWQGFQCKTELENRPTIISFWAKTTKPNINIYYIVGISSVTFPDGDTLISDGQWHRYTIFGKNGIKLYNNINNGFLEFNCTSGGHIEEVYVSSFKIEYGNTPTDWSPAPEDLIVKKDWEKQQHSLYGESLVTMLPSVQREVVIDNGTSRNNMWTDNNELNVGSRNIGGYAKIYCNGYKIHDKDDDDLLTADGNSITKSELLALPRGYDTSTSVVLPATTVNDTVFVKDSITLGLENIPDKGSVSFLKTFDGGSVTFICEGKNIVYTGDNAFDGKDGSTATVTIFENKCYIRIANV
jgi:hypothetical protein